MPEGPPRTRTDDPFHRTDVFVRLQTDEDGADEGTRAPLAPLGNTAQRLWLTARPFAVEKRAQEMIVALALEISTVRGPYGMKADSFAGLVP